MDRIESIKDILDKRELAIAEDDRRAVNKANKALNSTIKANVIKAQEALGADNKYKEYFVNNIEHIKELLVINKEINTIEEAIGLIHQVDFRYIFGLDVLMEEPFACEFINSERRISLAFTTEEKANVGVEKEMERFKGKEIIVSSYERFGMYIKELVVSGENTEAWITYNLTRNKYLYMVGSKKEDNPYVIISFDILDLCQIFMKCDISKAIQGLCELLGIRIKEFEEVRGRYERCKSFVRNNLTKDKFPILFELIGEQIPKLETIFEEGIDKLYYHGESKEGMVFSASMQYLADTMGKRKSTINPIVNIFALLGLLQKPDVRSGIYGKGCNNDITYYYIPEYNNEIFQKAEQLAMILLYNGERVTASSFSYSICIEKFGQEIANKIFKDKVTKARAS
ncbi:hypothetical protein [Clostridium saccharobutylicum]|uniref:Uncharacterized protein n=1 Tax=Clostridium saccharobutylicum DSM 13864 TaxID=1345695 RepID=U5MTM4_CLOSA|nr:hypothetical protein [Clostridium saccharobutylicum]AGX43915.1 hypothetical protein CLSA_c29480 [Clostridium saccharobutylicum DSM 13864]AQR91212.1 hypothetical protein CLOSC_29360 [Clostridium saccharobutylicum]AQS01116.1 hypothetical protein CSACC_29430 [Clostridium saccharobutylicum]AQS15099.1 hypothetical protein CLOSACC_29430 [Clostridium saccharobutylicum]MBA2905225.1 hypothetical protein [Clostridium saccharobutylicum]